MKTILFVLLFVCYCHCSPPVISRNNDLPPISRSFFDQKLRGKLESFREEMKSGVAFLDNIVLDPLNFDEAAFQFDVAELLAASLAVENFHLENLATYEVTEAKFSMSKPWNVTVELSWPGFISLETDYGLDARISDTYNIYGKGNLSVKADQFKFNFTMLLNVGEEHVQVDIQSLFVGLSKLKFVVTGLFNDNNLSALLSDVISDMVPELLTEYQEELVAFTAPYIENLINTELQKLDLETIISLVIGS